MLRPCVSFSMACGWSPVGLNWECSLKFIRVLQNAVVAQGDKIVVRDNDMVGQHDPDCLQRRL